MADDPNATDDQNPDDTTPDTSTGGDDADSPPFTKDDDGHWVDADGNRVFTKEEFDKGMKAARRDGAERARKKSTPQKTKPTKTKAKKAAEPPSDVDDDGPAPVTREEFERMQRKINFYRLSSVKKLNDRQATKILTLAQAEGIDDDDLAEYVEGAIDDLGISVNPPPSTTDDKTGKGDDKGKTVDDKKTDEPKPPQVTGSPGKVNALDTSHDGMVDVFSLTEEQAIRMGVDKIAEHYEKALAAADAAAGRPPLPRALRNYNARQPGN